MAAPALDPGTFDPDGDPTQLAQGPDGFVYVALTGNLQNKEFARINSDGTFTYFDTPVNGRSIVGLTSGPDVAGGPNNRLWLSFNGGVVKFDPAAGTGTDYVIPTIDQAQGITPDADGNLWVVDANDGLVKVAPDGTKIADVGAAQGAKAGGRGAALGSDGRIWSVNFNDGDVHATNKDAPYTTATYDAGAGNPQQIVAGPAGQLGYSYANVAVGRITTDGVPTVTSAPGSDAFGATFGRDGSYWFAEFLSQKVSRLTPGGDYTQPIELPANSGPRYLAADASNNIWVQTATSKVIHKITGVEPPPQPQPEPTTPQPTNPEPTGPSVTPDTVAPLLSKAKVDTKKRRLALTLDEPAALQVVIQQKVKRGKKNVWKRVRPVIKKNGKAGANTIALGKKFKKGAYRVRVTATDVLGNKTAKPKTVGFKVKR
jgi:streptogramin lyase